MNQTSKFSVRDICYAGLFAAVIAVMAQISIPMPLGVPMTMQTFAITLAAVVLAVYNPVRRILMQPITATISEL